MAANRSARYPGIPVVGEGGPHVQAGLWRGVAGPPGLPGSIAGSMAAKLGGMHASDAFRREMAAHGFGLRWADEHGFARFIAEEDRTIALAMSTIPSTPPEGLPIAQRGRRGQPPV